MHESDIINKAMLFIKEQSGLTMSLDEHFRGLQYHNDRVFFNVEIKMPCFDSPELNKLLRICGSDRTVKHVEPNGYKRIAIFVT